MTKMSNYCKAYPTVRLRAYPGWKEQSETKCESEFLYLHENYVVTDGIFVEENIVFQSDDKAWHRFCQEQVQFAPSNADAASS